MSGRIWTCLLALAAMATLSSLHVASASVGYHETFTQTIDPGNSLNGVTCVPATTECVVADSNGDAFYVTDVNVASAASWSPWAGPGASPGHAVECPSSTLCLLAAGEVSGGGGNLYRAGSLGGSFLTSFKPANGVGAISCPSSAFCVTAMEGGGFIRYSTNPSGILWSAVSIGTGAMKDAFCLSASSCAVVDAAGNVHVATTEEGVKETGGWTATNVNDEAELRSIACSSTTTCIAVDGSGEVLNLMIDGSGNAAVSRQSIDGADGLLAVDCMAATCAAVDQRGGIFASTNEGTDWLQRHGGGGALTSVSCASASLCAAVAKSGAVTTFNPATTTPPLEITTSSLPAGEAGAPYEAEAQATGGEPPYEWSATGLPPGLSIDSAGGKITGTQEETLCVGVPCEYAVTLAVTDDNGTEAAVPLTLELATNAYGLKVAVSGTGSGEVSSNPAGIDECGAPGGGCEAVYGDGTVVTLSAGSSPGSTFDGWSGGGCSGTGSCQVTMNAETDVSATFTEVPPPDADETPAPPHGDDPPAGARLTVRWVRAWVARPRCGPRPAPTARMGNRRCARLKVAIGGSIADEARGIVSVTVKTYLRGRKVVATRRARIVRGRWSARMSLPWTGRKSTARIYVAARFAGSSGIRAGHAKRWAKLSRVHRRRARKSDA